MKTIPKALLGLGVCGSILGCFLYFHSPVRILNRPPLVLDESFTAPFLSRSALPIAASIPLNTDIAEKIKAAAAEKLAVAQEGNNVPITLKIGDPTLALRSQAINLGVPLSYRGKYNVTAKLFGIRINLFPVIIKGSMVVTFTTTYRLSDGRTQFETTWAVTESSLQLSDIQKQLKKHLAPHADSVATSINAHYAKEWSTLSRRFEQRLSQETSSFHFADDFYLHLIPVAASLQLPVVHEGKMNVRATLFSETRAAATASPDSFPSLGARIRFVESITDPFSMALHISHDINTANERLTSILKQTPLRISIPDARAEVTIAKIQIHEAIGTNAVISITFTGVRERLLRRAENVNGTVFLKGTLRHAGNIFEIVDLDYDLETSNVLLRTAEWLLHKKFRAEIERNCKWMIAPKSLDETRNVVLLALKEFADAGFGAAVEGSIWDLRVANVFAVDNQLVAIVEAAGDLTFLLRQP